jgi:hypothetical protein
MRIIVLASLLSLGIAAAFAGEPVSNDPRGVDADVKPEELTVFMAQTAVIGPWPDNVFPADPKMENRDWVVEQDTGLKICRRTYVYINDKSAGGVTPSMTREEAVEVAAEVGDIIPLQPDATKPFVCARMGMMTPQLAPGTKWYNYKFACPQRILDEKGRTRFKEPDCPIDCHCIDEPVGL